MNLSNNIVVSDYSSRGALWVISITAPTFITNSIIWGNTKPGDIAWDIFIGGLASVTLSHSDIGEIDGSYNNGGGNISLDPLFYDPDNGNFHLSSTSPCIDAGTDDGAPNTDFEGDLRPIDIDGVDNNGELPEFDMGADEFSIFDCGDGILEYPEQCDDGNTYNGDGCSNICESEIAEEEFDEVQIIDNGDGTYDYSLVKDGVTLIETNNNEGLIDLIDFNFTSLGNDAMSISNLPLNGTTKSVILSYKTELCAVDDEVFVASLGNWECSSDPDRILWTQSGGNPCGELGNPVEAKDENGDPLPQYTCEKFIQGNETYAKMSGFTHTTVMGEDTAAIPTLSEWGIIIFMTLMMGIGVVILRKRRME